MVAIDDWVQKLAEIPEEDFCFQCVLEILKQYTVRPETLQPYLFYSKANYTRNLIFKNELFEVMAICWEVGQASRIHNHRDQCCWMVAPIGRLRVQNFRVEDRNDKQGTCRLVASRSYVLDAKQPMAVEVGEPVHQVLNLADFGQRATSLHIYSRPFNSCEVYSLEKGTYFDVPLFYTSEYGKLCPGKNR